MTPCLRAAAAPPTIEVVQAGAANVLPPGRYAGIEVAVDPGSLEPGAYVLEWESRTPDGDTVARSQSIPLAGAPVREWIYGLVPRVTDRPMRISLRHPDDLTLLASTQVSDTDPGVLSLDEGAELILVVGDRSGGLEDYDAQTTASITPWTTIETFVRTIPPDAVPDDAAGLAPASTILMTGRPDDLSAASRDALRGWLEAGGHLIVSLPTVGDPWEIRGSRPLWPQVLDPPSERVSISLRSLATALSPDPLAPLQPGDLPITVFPGAVGPSQPWHEVLASPSGQPLAIARPAGHGRLTVLGLDVASPVLTRYTVQEDQTGPLPAAATFWNPILGRRGDALTPRQRRQRAEGSRLPPAAATITPLSDDIVNSGIQQTVAAGGRLALVFGWVIGWLLLGGPGLWWGLHRLGRPDLAWPAFGVLGGVGAVAAWAVAGGVSLSGVEGRHFTIVDELAHTPVQRVRSWVDLRIPGAGRRDVGIAGVDGFPARIDTWATKGPGRATFMDTRLLRTDAESPHQVPMQARATSQSFAMERFGYSNAADDGPWLRSVAPVTTVRDAAGRLKLSGRLQSGLASPLRDVTLLWVESRRPPRRDGGPPSMPANVWAWSLTDPIPPGGVLDLATLPEPEAGHAASAHLESLAAGIHKMFGLRSAAPPRHDAVELLGLYRLTPPPHWPAGSDPAPPAVHRMARGFAADLDLGAGLGGPMLLITGFVEDDPLPVPMFIDGDPIDPPLGETMLRWSTWLPDAPPRPDPFSGVR
ncbi:MAG: hypothetical protein QF733_01855 [Phycisphaerales bacterium]|jgi:hypothetical protein|nr:hypothetical protein [Phycisphaerales bacterium]